MEKYNVKVHMAGTQVIDGETDETITNALGQASSKDGVHYIVYSEEKIKTMIKVEENAVEVVKRGDIESKMRFAPGEDFAFSYGTAFGNLEMSVKTKDLRIVQEEGNFKIYIDYELFTAGVRTSENHIFVRIRQL